MSYASPHARGAVSLLLAASGVAWLAAARERWWPACPWGDFDSPACLRIQDHAYDNPTATGAGPWLQVGHAAELQAAALVLLAVAIACLPLLWSRRPVAVMVLSTAALSLSFVAVAVATSLSVVLDRPFDFPGLAVAGILVGLGWPLFLIVAIVVVLADPYLGIWRAAAGWRLVFLLLLLASTPLAQVVVAPMAVGYMSYDTAPWSDAVCGGLLLFAALTVWPAAAPRIARVAQVGPGRMSAAR
jgi:hypothetical protein